MTTQEKMTDNYDVFGQTFLDNKNKSDVELIRVLIQKGFDKQNVHKYAVLTPIAFGRFYLKLNYENLKFSKLYHITDTNKFHALEDDDIYIWSYNLAKDSLQSNVLSKEMSVAIANRSPEIKGMIQAKLMGKEVEGMEFETLITI